MSQGKDRAWRWCSVVTAILLTGPAWSAPSAPHSKLTRTQPHTAIAAHRAALPARAAGKPRVMQINKPRVSGVGGAAAYDARKGAVISGSLVHHR
jgi:hypothetical protein